MRIALVGWYGHENLGDDRLEYALRSAFHGHTVTAFDFDQWRWLPPLLARYDFVIFGGGTLFTQNGRGIRLARKVLQQASRPFAVVGLGIDRVPADSQRHLDWLIDHASLFVVRDKKSHQFCGCRSRVLVAPDLSWLTPFPLQPRPKTSDTVAVNLANYGTPDPSAAQALLQVAPRLIPSGRLVAWPFCRDAESDDYSFLAAHFDAPEEVNAAALPVATRLCVAHRFHAMLFATQMGVPFVPVVTQNKGEMFVSELGYPVPVVRHGTMEEWEAALGYILSHEAALVEFLRDAREQYLRSAAGLLATLQSDIRPTPTPRTVLARQLRRLAKRAHAAVQGG